MNHSAFPYPATPQNVPPSITEVSPAFARQVKRVMGSVTLFLVVYIILFVLSLALAVGCVLGGAAIITGLTSFIGILVGGGVIGVGVMIFIFLVKFLFSVSRVDRSDSIEITKADQPELFAFIKQLTTDTQTPFPKRIYLSADVNASVFYDSSFWSMFLPVRKNLKIGLGLVNAVNLSEFKAVMAHEFGHFSQRSMKLGSFVYQVNRVIHNMLFENSTYAKFLNNWGNISSILGLFASITASIVGGIQSILGKMYGIINKSYMSLSREMEFHADAVAASVSGSKSLVSALHRLELANAGYSVAIDKCNELLRDNKTSGNIYPNQSAVIRQIAQEHKLQEEHGLPVVNDAFLASNNTSRVNFKDQWASHPTTEDRSKHLLQLGVEATTDHNPAWIIFRDVERFQQLLTQKIYQKAIEGKQVEIIDASAFEVKLREDINRFTLPKEYLGYFDNRRIAILNDEELDSLIPDASKQLDELISPETARLGKKIKSLHGELQVLESIRDKQVDVETFDFDGQKYERDQASNLVEQVKKELEDANEFLNQTDRNIIRYFLAKAGEQSGELKDQYRHYFTMCRESDQLYTIANDMLNVLSPVFAGQVTEIEVAKTMINTLITQHQPVFKQQLQKWIDRGIYDKDPVGKKEAEQFITSDLSYFSGNSFVDSDILQMHATCNNSWSAVNNWIFDQFKILLEKQWKMSGEKALA